MNLGISNPFDTAVKILPTAHLTTTQVSHFSSWLSLAIPRSHLKQADRALTVGTGQKAKTYEGFMCHRGRSFLSVTAERSEAIGDL